MVKGWVNGGEGGTVGGGTEGVRKEGGGLGGLIEVEKL